MSNLTDFFNQLKNERVLVLGDIMLDRYLYGRVDRISPEAPVPVVALQSEEEKLGGAANVALNLIALKSTVALIGGIGKDVSGDKILKMLPASGIQSKYLLKFEQRRTTVKSRVIGGAQHLLRVDYEDTHDLNPFEEEQLIRTFKMAMDTFEPSIVLIQDYNKGLLTVDIIRHILDIASSQNVFTAVDPKKADLKTYLPCDLIKPNLKEFNAHFGQSLSPDELSKMAKAFVDQNGVGRLMITLSEKGVLITDKETQRQIPTIARDIVDVCGAGDAVFAIASLATKIGLDAEKTGQLSNASGGLVCSKLGVVAVKLSDLRQEVNRRSI